MTPSLTVCGTNCSTCIYFKNDKCAGCEKIEGHVFWTEYVSVAICPVYDCVVNKRSLAHCGKCPEIPCSLWYELKDPGYTDEQHAKSIKERAALLKSI